MPITTQSLVSSPVFRNRTNGTTEDNMSTQEKISDEPSTLPVNTDGPQLPLFAASSSVASMASAHSARSPTVDEVMQDIAGEGDRSRGPSSEVNSDTWISPVLSQDTSSWRPSSSESLLSSDATSTYVVGKARPHEKPSSTTIRDAETYHIPATRVSPRPITRSATPDDCGGTARIAVARSDSQSMPHSDSLGIFSSSSYIPHTSSLMASFTSDSLATMSDASSSLSERSTTPAMSTRPSTPQPQSSTSTSNGHDDCRTPSNGSQLPGAATSSHSFSREPDVDDSRPTKRRRRLSSDSTLPPSDIIASSVVTSSSAPSLPIASSPMPRHPVQRHLSYVPPQSAFRRASGRVSRPTEKYTPRTLVAPPATLAGTNTTRRSARNMQYHPLGPRHLEYDYHVAYEELREATILAAQALHFQWPKRRPRITASKPTREEVMDELSRPTLAEILAAKFPYVERARRKVNEADQRLQEALDRGETWENTVVPEAVLAPTYEAIEGNMPPPAPPTPRWSDSRKVPKARADDTAPRPATRASVPRDTQVVTRTRDKAQFAATKAILDHKPKPIVGKRRRVVLSSEVDSDKTNER